VAIDSKHLPDDPKVLQHMVLDLMAQLDRESIERNKIETLLRELLDAKRSRKSEQLSADQLALFAELLQARQAQAESPAKGNDSDDDAARVSWPRASAWESIPTPGSRMSSRASLPIPSPGSPNCCRITGSPRRPDPKTSIRRGRACIVVRQR